MGRIPSDYEINASIRGSQSLSVRFATPDEWAESRRFRLEMLADTPHAFGDRLADVVGWDDERWRTRLASHLLPDSMVVVAVDDDDRWVGQMCAREYRNYDPARAWLLGVYLSPDHRGAGLAERLLRRVEEWVAGRGLGELYLDVHERSIAARAFYERLGFAYTGRTQPYPLELSEIEYEMVKRLQPAS